MTGRIFDVSIRAAAVTAGLSLVVMTVAAMFPRYFMGIAYYLGKQTTI